MKFKSDELVIKISVSDMLVSQHFYEQLLGCKVDERYTIDVNKKFETNSYMQLNMYHRRKKVAVLGLYKDINQPFDPLPQTGSVPSFIVADIKATLKHFIEQKVKIDLIDGQYIVENTSDEGYIDHFFFFRDPDNNSLVIRQNQKRT